MANKRIHEIAKETDLKSKDVMDKLEQMGIAVRTASSSITIDQYEAFKNKYPKLYEGGVGTGAPPIAGKERVVTVVRTDQESQVTEKVTERRVSRTVIRRRSRGDEGPVDEPADEAPAAEAPAARAPVEEDSPRLLRVSEAPRAERPRIELPEKPTEPEAPAAEAPPQSAAAEAPAAPTESPPSAPRVPVEAGSDAPRLKIVEAVKPDFKPRVEAAPPPMPGAASQPMPGEPTPEEGEGRKKGRKGKKGRDSGPGDETDWRETKRMMRKRRDFVDAEILPTGREMGARRKGKRRGAVKKVAPTSAKPAQKKPIRIDESITLGEMAAAMGVKAAELIRELMGMGVMATANQAIDLETAELLAATYDYEVERVGLQEDEVLRRQTEDKPEDLKPRPPVVTIMGHVDHGKTSLLDKIREARVAEGEAGGITQHIGAYHVDTSKGPLTFLDTPGHEAFTAMRARGAKVTDIVVLVIAADDGVKPQTIEAINHSKAAGVPIVVAVNKIDKPGAKPEQARQQLTEYSLVAEEWGGDTMFVDVSAKTGQGIDTLLETIALQSEVLELKANPDKAAAGIIVEARLERGRGPVATVLVQEGTLHLGDAIVAGQHFGKARALTDDMGKAAESIGPGMPVELLGLSGVPAAGDFFDAAANEKLAKQVAAKRAHKLRESELASLSRTSLEQLYAKISAGEAKELPVVVKADVQGSVEAIVESLNNLSLQRCAVKVIHAGAGGVTESDVNLAAASDAIIVAFNVRPERMAADLADSQQIQIKHYSVIYDLIDDITAAMEGLLEPDRKETVVGHAEVREVYTITKVGKVAGCYVTDGKATRGSSVRVLRDNKQIYDSQLSSLKRFKDDAKEVPAGMECGLTVKDYTDVRSGDVLEFYEIEEIAVKLADVRVKEEAAARARTEAEAAAKAAADSQQATS